ncbi:MAG: rhomboid family protein [Rariglobus sp.]
MRHDEREAVGRCVECEGSFCRECLTEHDDRLYCAPCFARRIAAGKRNAARRGVDWRRWKAGIVTAGSILCLVWGFYALGRVLAAIPAELHDATVWKENAER